MFKAGLKVLAEQETVRLVPNPKTRFQDIILVAQDAGADGVGVQPYATGTGCTVTPDVKGKTEKGNEVSNNLTFNPAARYVAQDKMV